MNQALLVIDMQNDFMDGGALGVPGARALVPLIKQLMTCFGVTIASKDWHPQDHKSFAANNPPLLVGDVIELEGIKHTLWSIHCVAGSFGAEMVKGLDTDLFDYTVYKGSEPTIDSYSAFFDNAHQRSTKLDEALKQRGIETLYLCGVATDYCVKFTALDASSLGYKVFVIEDACKGIELKDGDIAQAIKEMKAAGVRFISSASILKNNTNGL